MNTGKAPKHTGIFDQNKKVKKAEALNGVNADKFKCSVLFNAEKYI